MRTDHEISKDCVLTSYDNPVRGLHARRPGKDNTYRLEPIVEIDEKAMRITVHESVISKFGLALEVRK